MIAYVKIIILKVKEAAFYVIIFINMEIALLVILLKIMRFLIMVNAIVSKDKFGVKQKIIVLKIILIIAFKLEVKFVENAKKIIA